MTSKSIFYLTLFVMLLAYNVICEESVYNLKCLHSTGDCTVLDDYLDYESIDKTHRGNYDKRSENNLVYKTNDVKCLTGDCRVLTVKIKRGGNKRLACIGDPYSSNGSRCLPIEGLYIG